MIQAPISRDILIDGATLGRGPGYGYDGGGYGAGGWVAGGVGFLFLVFIIFGFAFFQRAHGKDVHDSIRDAHSCGNTSALAAAEFRGETRVREQDLYEQVRANSAKLDALAVGVTHGFDKAVYTTREAVKDLELYGDNVGFRAKEVVYPDPCGHRRDCHERGPFKTITSPFTAPTTVAETFPVCA